MLEKIAFIDRDGTLIEEPEKGQYPGEVDEQIDRIEKLRILPGVIEGLQTLIRHNFILVMVTNQDHLGSPIFPRESFELPHQMMLEIFHQHQIHFEQIFICPHGPDDGCDCRKPKTGMVEGFLAQRKMNPDRSFVYGDRESDRGFAEKLGIRFFKVPTNGSFNLKESDLQ